MTRSIRRHERLFKIVIVGATSLTIAMIATNHRAGQRLFGLAFGQFADWSAGAPRDRVRAVRQRSAEIFTRLGPSDRRLLIAAGLDPDRALYSRANFDAVMVFSSAVFQSHPQCGYRLRPGISALWVESMLPEGFPAALLVPDSPQVRECVSRCGKRIFSTERYNALGFRGPEPNPEATVRVLELGDSFLHGVCLDEHETPSACLQQMLQQHLGAATVSVFNAGVIGYSTEQEYYTLVEQYERVKPNVVILHFFANDVHSDYLKVLETGSGAWDQAQKWAEEIRRFCLVKQVPIELVSVIPARPQLVLGGRSLSNYQGQFSRVVPLARNRLIDSLDALTLANERLKTQGAFGDWRTDHNLPVFLKDDAHLSPAGAAAYAAVVADRVLVAIRRSKLPGPPVSHRP